MGIYRCGVDEVKWGVFVVVRNFAARQSAGTGMEQKNMRHLEHAERKKCLT